MAVVPLTTFLARRDGTSTEGSGVTHLQAIREAAEAAYQKGMAEGIERAKQVCEAALAQNENEFKSRLDQMRRTWVQKQGALLARQSGDALASLKSEIEETVARILRPFVAKALLEEALSKLAIEIEKLLSEDNAIQLKITGPADLISELKNLIPNNAPVTVLEGDAPEVTVFANKTVIETRLNEWLDCIGVDSHVSEENG